ncbi:Hypothetical protein IALB_2223 [Ignavibacterium album JCM 16511]|uniref:DUF1579 domain-containing protein n=1 Tax=Ignavibacterium album (strain DSM 19864 / JCM 16511 / NBRC 101810 / Mat9-16) TaxID=945713 RepID=I0ALR9_IGNAJ|nr:DUF1579 domain-containing protein [Ignavibacterium album]AFH49926.1 Hypothetical protein IALB_2223 [Ignavibacterium album JCM 16511]
MKNFLFTLVFLTFLWGTSFAQNEEMNSDEQMKIWIDYMTPGSMHEMMAKQVGEWKMVSKMWMEPNAEPVVSEGTVNAEMILGGRYLKMVAKFPMMGMQTEGWSLEAYDNGKKEFINIWIDNMGTGVAISTGKFDDATKSIIYNGKMYDPVAGKDVEFKSISKMVTDNQMVFEMFGNFDGKEVKMMEINYTR